MIHVKKGDIVTFDWRAFRDDVLPSRYAPPDANELFCVLREADDYNFRHVHLIGTHGHVYSVRESYIREVWRKVEDGER